MRITIQDDQLSIIHPPRTLWRLFGTPFLFGGLFLEYEAATAWHLGSSATPLLDHLVVMLLPLLSVFVGIACWFGFYGVSINRAGTKYTTWWGIHRAWQKTVKSLRKIHTVHITKVTRTVRNHYNLPFNDVYYAVRLGGKYGTIFDAYALARDGRQMAKAVAEFLGCELIDDIVDHSIESRLNVSDNSNSVNSC